MCGRCEVGHPLAVAEAQRLELALRRARASRRPRRTARRARSRTLVVREPSARAPPRCRSRDLEEAREELLRRRAPADGQEVDELDEEPRLPAARLRAPRSTSSRRPGTKRSWPIRSSGPLGTSRMPVASTTSTPGRPRGEALVPVEHVAVTKPSSVARHGTIAGTQVRCSSSDRSDTHRAEQMGGLRLLETRPACRWERMTDALGRLPHGCEYTQSAPPSRESSFTTGQGPESPGGPQGRASALRKMRGWRATPGTGQW